MKIISLAYQYTSKNTQCVLPSPLSCSQSRLPPNPKGLALSSWGKSDWPPLRTARQHTSLCPTQWREGMGKLSLWGEELAQAGRQL